MAIRLYLTQERNLEINSLGDDSFSIEDAALSYLFSFKKIELDEHHIVIDPANRLGETIDYILAEFKKRGINFELDINLKHYCDNYSFEVKKIRDIKAKKKMAFDSMKLPSIFSAKRKPLNHQVRAVKHALWVGNEANFSVPGSGKTQVGLGFFAALKYSHEIEKALVIGPASCFEPWETEAKECLRKGIRIIRWTGSVKKRRKTRRQIKESDLVLVTYQTACNDALLLEEMMRRYKVLLMLDEAHYIKNPTGARAQAILRLSNFATKRLLLTGTPAPHSLADIWTQFSFLWPSQRLLGNYDSFSNKVEGHKNPETKFGNELSHFFVRTTKDELRLPRVKNHTIPIKKSEIPIEQSKIIEFLELKTLHEARKFSISDMDRDVLRKWRTARIIRLLQAVSNPALLLSRLEKFGITGVPDINTSKLINYAKVFLDHKKIPAKVLVVVNLAKKIVETGHKVIIWTWFVDNINLIQGLLKEFNPLRIFGEIRPYINENAKDEETREKNIHEFKTRKDRPILIANPAACAESISLHKYCQNAIYLDRNFNCGQFLQSMDRIHRVGMPKGTTAEYYIPFINCAVERSIDNRLRRRQKVLYRFLNDPMPVLGIDEELWVSDSEEELEAAYNDVLKEISNAKK